MNVNLVSPVENGNNFTIRFKDDIIIPEKSKIYLNFASFSRVNDVELYEDQTIKILIDNTKTPTQERNLIRPENLTALPFNANTAISNNTISIPSGTYNYQRLFTLITTGINDILRNPANPADLSMYRAVSYADIDNSDDDITQGNISFSIGIIKNKATAIPKIDIALDNNNKINCDGTGIDAGSGGYRKTTANVIVPSGLRKTDSALGGGAFLPDNTNSTWIQLTDDKVFGYYTAKPLIAISGTGTGATCDFNVNNGVGGLRTMNGGQNAFFNVFQNAGTADKTDGFYTKIPILASGGGQGIEGTIDFGVVGGAIDISTLIVSTGQNGRNYQINDILFISTGASTTGGSAIGTGGTQDTTIKVENLSTKIDYTSIKIGNIGNDFTIGDTLQLGNSGTPEGGTTPDRIDVYQLQLLSGKKMFDNYALSSQHYWHIGYNDNTPFGNANVITFQTAKTLSEMNLEAGCVQIGLYSSEYAKGLRQLMNGGVHDNNYDFGGRTHGTNALNYDADGAPFKNPLTYPFEGGTQSGVINNTAPFIVSVNARPLNPVLEVWLGLNGIDNSNSVKNWNTPNQKISKMRKVFSQRLDSITNYVVTNHFKCGIQTYYDSNNLANRRLYFRVLNLNGVVRADKSIEEQHSIVLYDSRALADTIDGTYFNDSFFLNNAVDGNGLPLIDYESSGAGTIIKKISGGTTTKTNGLYQAEPIANITRIVNGTATNLSTGGLKVDFLITNGVIDYVNPSADVGHGGTAIKVGDTFQISNVVTGGLQDDIFEITAQSLEPRLTRIRSQMPFNIYTSALTLNDGFDYISAPLKVKDDATPLTFLESYELECTEELARYINLNTNEDRNDGVTDILYPNTGDAKNNNLLHIEDMNLDWRNESYSISLKEVPIRNYKNNDRKQNGGFAKTILANCPVPFSDSQSYSTKSKQMITATYKPNYQIINNLYNQAMTTNHFSIEIRKLASDRPATEIKKSIVNFTIQPPDDYSGNINSVDLLK